MNCVVRLFNYRPEILTKKEIKEAYHQVSNPSPLLRKYIQINNETNLEKEPLKKGTKIFLECLKAKKAYSL